MIKHILAMIFCTICLPLLSAESKVQSLQPPPLPPRILSSISTTMAALPAAAVSNRTTSRNK